MAVNLETLKNSVTIQAYRGVFPFRTDGTNVYIFFSGINLWDSVNTCDSFDATVLAFDGSANMTYADVTLNNAAVLRTINGGFLLRCSIPSGYSGNATLGILINKDDINIYAT